MSDWQTWLTVLGGSGVIALLATIGKGIYGWLTGSSQRRMDHAADAIDSMATAGMWADAYWRARAWCTRRHGWSEGYPPPPDDDDDTDHGLRRV